MTEQKFSTGLPPQHIYFDNHPWSTLWKSESPVEKFKNTTEAKNPRIDTLKRVKTTSLYPQHPSHKTEQISAKRNQLNLLFPAQRKMSVVSECLASTAK